MSEFIPKVVCFSCNFGWGYLADQEQLGARLQNWVPVMCSCKVDAVHVLRAFQQGADGVLLLGCREGECHFQDGNYQAKKRVALLKKVLAAHSIEPERLTIQFSLDPEGSTLPGLVDEMGRKLRAIGPLSMYGTKGGSCGD